MSKDGKMFSKRDKLKEQLAKCFSEIPGVTEVFISENGHWEPIGKLETDYLRAKLESIARDAEDLWQWMEGKEK